MVCNLDVIFVNDVQWFMLQIQSGISDIYSTLYGSSAVITVYVQ